MSEEASIASVIDPMLDLISKDLARVLARLQSGEDRGHVGIIYGPIICLKQSYNDFVKSYRLAIDKLEELAGGPRVKDLRFRVLEDVDKNYWGDVGRHHIVMDD